MEDTLLKLKFLKALTLMAIETKPIQGRVADAYNCELAAIQPGWLPDEQRKAFNEIVNGISKHQAIGNEGAVNATCSRMSDREASEWAEKIADLCGEFLL